MKEETKLNIDPREVKRILTETRNWIWILCRYRINQKEFENVSFRDIFDLGEISQTLFDLEYFLTKLGVMAEEEINE